VQHLEIPVLIRVGAGGSEAGQHRPGCGRRGLIDGGPLLKEVRTSIICSLMPAFDSTRTSIAEFFEQDEVSYINAG
jgi:hypothetical protein